MNLKFARRQIAACSLMTLAACGGGAGGTDAGVGAGTGAGTSAGTGTGTAGNTPAADLTVSGLAAERSAPLAGAAVGVKCARGNGVATTGADGSYAVTIPNGLAPCALELTGSAGRLRSVVPASASGRATANITPLTELLAAQIAGGPAATLFATFDGQAQGKVSAAALAQARADLEAALASRVPLAGLDPVAGALQAGGAAARALDALATTLTTSGLTLDQLSAALAANRGSPAPVETVIQPRAATCPGLRSGRLRSIDPLEPDQALRTEVVQIDAGTLTARSADGMTSTLADGGSCSFGAPDGTLLVAQGGFAVFRPSTGPGVAILMPEQKLALADLAGTWNGLEYRRNAATQPLRPVSVYFTADAAGKTLSSFTCEGLGACRADPVGNTAFAVDPEGGFRAADANGVLRLFAYKTASGAMTAVVLYPGQLGFVVATKQTVRTLPGVGDVTRNRSFSINASGVGSPITALETRTVTAVNAATQSYTRVQQSDGLVDGFRINAPRDGLYYRAAGTGSLTGGGTASISEIVLLPMPGGVSVFTSVTAPNNFFGFSIQP